MLHQQAHARDADPAAKAHDQRLAAGLDELDDVRVQADGAHGHHDQELAERLERGEHARRHAGAHAHGRDHGREQEVEDEHREDLLEIHFRAVGLGALRAHEGEHERDRDDGQCARELDGHGLVERLTAEPIERVPRGGCRRDGRRVVDGRAGEDAERLAVRGRKAEQRAERGEEDGGEHIEEENDRDRLRDFFVVGIDDGGGRGDGRAAADRRADAHERRDLAGDVHQLVQEPRHDERRRDRHDDDRQRLLAGLPDDGQVHAEAEQDDGVLQHFFRHERDAGLRRRLVAPEQRDDHTGEDAEHRAADDREFLPEQPAGHGHDEAHKDAFPVFLNEVHSGVCFPFLCSAVRACQCHGGLDRSKTIRDTSAVFFCICMRIYGAQIRFSVRRV